MAAGVDNWTLGRSGFCRVSSASPLARPSGYWSCAASPRDALGGHLSLHVGLEAAQLHTRYYGCGTADPSAFFFIIRSWLARAFHGKSPAAAGPMLGVGRG